MSGAQLINLERTDQLKKIPIESDAKHNTNGELVTAATALAHGQALVVDMPSNWDKAACKKMVEKPYKDRLIIAGALMAAEYDRLKFKESFVGQKTDYSDEATKKA